MNLGILRLFSSLIVLTILLGGCTKEFQPLYIKNIQQYNHKKSTSEKFLKSSTTLDTKDLKNFTFDIIKKGKDDNNTLLIVGGIQGDEPGGFMAASLISTHYTVKKGSVWIVPNLNFYSIIKRSRGPFGDMNRKFASLSKDDPEFEIVEKIKGYISSDNVKLILNLHDGSGFYRKKYIDNMHQPRRWGQTIVIDEPYVKELEKYNDLEKIAQIVVDYSNENLLKEEHRYLVKNTNTKSKTTYEEQEMAKTLTYFAILNKKAAFGHETSKSLNLNHRVYYKLLAIEKFMDIMGIEYQRNFKLDLKSIDTVLKKDIDITFGDSNIKLPLSDIRNILNYFPINANGIVKYLPSNPLIKIIKQKDTYTIYYGNNKLTTLRADYSKHIEFDTQIPFTIDGEKKLINFGSTVNVKENFIVHKNDFRVNVIGYTSKNKVETDIKIKKNMFLQRYSVLKHGDLYRVEFYKGDNFVGMILVNYK